MKIELFEGIKNGDFNKLRKKEYYFLQFIIIFFLTSCSEKNPNCPEFFLGYKENMPKKCFIKIENEICNDSFPGYRIWFFDGKVSNFHLLKGIIYENENKIYFISDSSMKVKFVLFDFGLNVGESAMIDYSRRFKENDLDTIVNKKYNLKLIAKFFDPIIKDSVYNFRFIKYEVFSANNDIVYFVGKRAGIIGCYLTDKSELNSFEIVVGGFIGNVYKNIFDYSKVRIVAVE